MDKQEIAKALYRWFQSSGADLFFNEEGERDYSMTFSRNEIFEIATDMNIGNGGIPWEEWRKLSEKEKEEIKMLAFPNEIWGY